MRTIEIGIVALLTASLAVGGVLAFVLTPPPSPCAGVTGATRLFTIIVDSSGYNDSVSHSGQWPIITVQRCDYVVFTIRNDDTQSHGFAVQSYTSNAFEVVGQATLHVPAFQVTRGGQFRIYCTIPCTIHSFMQNGLLKVV